MSILNDKNKEETELRIQKEENKAVFVGECRNLHNLPMWELNPETLSMRQMAPKETVLELKERKNIFTGTVLGMTEVIRTRYDYKPKMHYTQALNQKSAMKKFTKKLAAMMDARIQEDQIKLKK